MIRPLRLPAPGILTIVGLAILTVVAAAWRLFG